MIDKLRFFKYLATFSRRIIATVTGNVPLTFTEASEEALYNYRITCKSGGVGDLTQDNKYNISFYVFDKDSWGTINLGSLNYRDAFAAKPGIYQVLDFCTTYGAKANNNIYCGKLKKADYVDIYYERVDNAICINPSNGRVYVRCTSATDVKSFLSGNSLIFEKENTTSVQPKEASIVLDKPLYANEYVDYVTQTLHKTAGDTTIQLPAISSFAGDNIFFVATTTKPQATVEYYK